ncbi:MAG: penicillin-binding transpeptidase domain-containing protein [Pyrinomonadaceae bacterium]
MTRTLRNPTFHVAAIILVLCFGVLVGPAAARKPAKKAAPAKKGAKQERGNSRADRNKKSAVKESRAERGRNAKKRNERAASRNDRRRGAERADDRRSNKRLSKRERQAQARREAEERRRRAEAARRAELARLAAIARQRAIDQAYRSEVQQNVLKDDPTGEDLEVRRVAMSALGNYAGSVVVMDPKTGRVYTIVNQEWGVRRGFKPCSTVKLVTGLAGLEERVIDVPQPGISNVSLTMSQFDLTDALAFSHNGFFQKVGSRVGFSRMSSYARQLGLGAPTGINHANEHAGRVPSFENEQTIFRMSSHGDNFEVTPVQLASLVSVFANGGTVLVPHLPRTPQEATKFRPEVRRQLHIPQDVLRRMLPGMVGAVKYGSGKKSNDPTQTIAGKTGTCIGAGGQWVGLFTSYAPVEDPQLAIAVITRGSDSRAHIPAAIAGQIYRTLNYRFGKRGNRAPYALTPDILAPRPKIDPSTIKDEGADEDDADSIGAAAETIEVAPNAGTTNGSNVKRVLQAIPQRPNGGNTNNAPALKAPITPAANPTPTAPTETRPRRVQNNEQ